MSKKLLLEIQVEVQVNVPLQEQVSHFKPNKVLRKGEDHKISAESYNRLKEKDPLMMKKNKLKSLQRHRDLRKTLQSELDGIGTRFCSLPISGSFVS